MSLFGFRRNDNQHRQNAKDAQEALNRRQAEEEESARREAVKESARQDTRLLETFATDHSLFLQTVLADYCDAEGIIANQHYPYAENFYMLGAFGRPELRWWAGESTTEFDDISEHSYNVDHEKVLIAVTAKNGVISVRVSTNGKNRSQLIAVIKKQTGVSNVY